MKISNRSIFVAVLFLILAAFLSPWALAQEEKGPREVIQDSTDRVLAILDEQRENVRKNGDEVTHAMAEQFLQTLDPVVDFDSIARGVMGKHRQAATKEQVSRFSTIFKDSLSQLYIKSFLNFEVKEVEVFELPNGFDPTSATKASVEMEATTGKGETFSLRYSMRKNEDNQWVVRNMIVDGVNLGLTYMNQFDGTVDRHGSIDKAIESWPEEMEDETFDSQDSE